MIEHVNESIERTARLTGLSPENPFQDPVVCAGQRLGDASHRRLGAAG